MLKVRLKGTKKDIRWFLKGMECGSGGKNDRTADYKQRTIKRKIASVKAFFNYLDYEEKIESNPFNRGNI